MQGVNKWTAKCSFERSEGTDRNGWNYQANMLRKTHTHTHTALTCIVLKLACSNYPAAELLGWQEWKWVPIIKCTTEKIEHYRRSTMGLMLLCH